MANYLAEGKLVGLRAFKEEDLNSNWYDWFNDPEITKYLRWGAIPNTTLDQREYFQNIVVKSMDKVVFAVENVDSKELIGVCSIGAIDWIFRRGEIAVVIGERKYHRGGYALESYHLTVKHAFLFLNLHKIKAVISEENEASVKLCELIGFRQVGVLNDECYKNGKYSNCVILELLKSDWDKLNRN